jgi:hypothetical protein
MSTGGVVGESTAQRSWSRDEDRFAVLNPGFPTFDYAIFEKPKREFSMHHPIKDGKNAKKQKQKKRISINPSSVVSSTVSFHHRSSSSISKQSLVPFRVNLYGRKLDISLHKECSLEDLYIKIYNAVYPEFSTENRFDIIPPPGATYIPKLYDVCLVNKKEELMNIPVHKFITLSSYMTSNAEYFVPKRAYMFGPIAFNIYVLDEESLMKAQENQLECKKEAKARGCFAALIAAR